MEQHHQEAINKFLEIYTKDNNILAILLGGSLAHGFAVEDSDIDINIIVGHEEYLKRKHENKLAFSLRDICTYENGYIDCKVIDMDLLIKISEKGSDPSRYAFANSAILYSKIDDIKPVLKQIDAYPTGKKDERRKRFSSQLLAWKWFYSEGTKKQNKYLIYLALQKIVLFSCRLILNENELLYPFHKWLLKVLETAKRKPENIPQQIDELLTVHSVQKVNDYCEKILAFVNIDEKSIDWPNYFLKDSEQNWIDHEAPVDDL